MQLTSRDFEIIGFVLNMKFASVPDIHRKFFRKKRDGGISDNEWYVRERLRELTKEGYLQSVRYRFEHKSYFIGTKHGFDLLKYSQVTMSPAKPLDRIDVRTFDHDIKVMQSRLLLEDFESVTDWQSDRQLKAIYTEHNSSRLSRDSAPDGVYRSHDGKTIAFEYEIAKKTKKRYQDKIRGYVSNIRQTSSLKTPKYDHVRMVCENESVYKILLDSTRIWRQYFTIELAVSFYANFENRTVDIPQHSVVKTIESVINGL